LYSDRHQEHTR